MTHHENHDESHTFCPACEIGPFIRNNYFTGKLMLERDFTDEQRYFIEKIRHHHQRLHGWGVVCGLKVKQHANPDCRVRYICIEPGTAIDCCGNEIVVREEECIDITQLPAIKALIDKNDGNSHTLRVCLRYRECPTEEIPVLYDECGCDDTRCAPNRILESYDIDVIIVQPKADDLPPPGGAPTDAYVNKHDCEEILWRHLDGCPQCDMPNCVVLATIEKYNVGDKIEDQTDPKADPNEDNAAHITRIDNRNGRQLLPSNQTLIELIECLMQQGPGGAGTPGQPGAPGEKGPKGDTGDKGDTVVGPAGPGLEEGLVQIKALSWIHNKTNQFLNVRRLDGTDAFSIVIEFTDEVTVNSIDSTHVFQLLVEKVPTEDNQANLESIFKCRCPIEGLIVPVKCVVDGPLIKSAKETPDKFSNGVAFVLPKKTQQILLEAINNKLIGSDFLVILRGDFVLDRKGKAIDAEFVRAELPTGDRPKGSPFGIQGGTFESWFSVREEG